MRKLLLLCALLLPLATPARADSTPQEQRSLFWYAEKSWAVGTIRLGTALKFREGKVLVFPAQITDLVWAPAGTKPRNLMLVYEMASSDDPAKPFFQEHDEIFAPIQLLPQHSYWKDNLPNTSRHAVAGGRRFAFRGDDIPLAKKVLGDYLTASEVPGLARWKKQLEAVCFALTTRNATLREEGVKYLQFYPPANLSRDLSDSAIANIRSFLEDDAPVDQKRIVVDALAAGKVEKIRPQLTKLSTREDALGAVALAGLEAFGELPPTARLVELSRSPSAELGAWAAGALGRQAGKDPAAAARLREILANENEDPKVLAAACEGLGQAGGDVAVAILGTALAAGKEASRPAGDALGRVGSPAAQQLLAATLRGSTGDAALAAAAGLFQTANCPFCGEVLREQYQSHPDEQVRHLIGVMLGVPLEHKH